MTAPLTETDVDAAARAAGRPPCARSRKVIVGQERVGRPAAGRAARRRALPARRRARGSPRRCWSARWAQALDLSFRRIQFTPDLMPTDIVGTEILEEDHGTGRRVFRFATGPVFTNLLLADEINRTPPKTQAALLEAMQEHAVTYGGDDLSAAAAVLRARDAEPASSRRAPTRCPRRSSTASCCTSADRLPDRRRGAGILLHTTGEHGRARCRR